jgi:hypothetical protein
MKSADKSAEKSRSFEELVSKFSENEILNTQAMSYVKGGGTEGEGNGGSPVIIIPK